MGSFSVSLVPLKFEGLQGNCAWAPEPVFPLDESARILGTTKRYLVKHTRNRHPEIRENPNVIPIRGMAGQSEVLDAVAERMGWDLSKVVPNLGTPFTDQNEWGELRLTLETPGGPQEHVCLTHHGLFRHAIYIRTSEARNYVLQYPRFICALISGRLRGPQKVAAIYHGILLAPVGRKGHMTQELAQQLGKGVRTIYRHMKWIREGKVDSSGLPLMSKPGPPKKQRSQPMDWII